MNRLIVPVLALLLCIFPQAGRAANRAIPRGGISFRAPSGFKKVVVPGFLWCGRNGSGERLTVQLWRRNTGLTRLAPVSAERLYPRLHRKVGGKVIKRGPEEGFTVRGAAASLVAFERVQYGRPFQSYQILALQNGDLYVFEYAAPTAKTPKGLPAFVKLLDSVHWRDVSP